MSFWDLLTCKKKHENKGGTSIERESDLTILFVFFSAACQQQQQQHERIC